MNYKPLTLLLLIVILFIASPNTVAQDIAKDSTTTPFRKGRWFAGLSGAIGSSSLENSSTIEKSTSNHYNIDFTVGKFVIDRLNVGFTAQLGRANLESDANHGTTTENIFLGPVGSYYLSKSDIGSLYFSLSPGVALYREEINSIQGDVPTNFVNNGIGFGALSTFGYSYVLFDRVSFDLGLVLSMYWLNIDQEISTQENITNQNYVLNDLTFSFGFNILLDKKGIE